MTVRLPVLTLREPWASALVRLDRTGARIKACTVQDHSRVGQLVVRADHGVTQVEQSGVWPFHGLGPLDVAQHAGCLLGVVRVVRPTLLTEGFARGLSPQEAALDTFTPGRWVWWTEDPRVFPRPLRWDGPGAVDLPRAMLEAAQPLMGGRGRNRDLLRQVLGGAADLVDMYGLEDE